MTPETISPEMYNAMIYAFGTGIFVGVMAAGFGFGLCQSLGHVIGEGLLTLGRWMKRRVFGGAVLSIVLLSTTTAHAQGIVRNDPGYGSHDSGLPTNTATFADLIGTGATIFFGGGGEVPVRDATTRSQTTITAIKTAAILVDALLQALTGGGPENETVGRMTGDFSEIAQDSYAITYGNDVNGALWNDTIGTMDHVFPDGGWVRNMVDRQKRAIKTQQRTTEILHRRFLDLPADVARKKELYDSVIGCQGRNCAIQASGAVAADANQEALVTQQILMAGFNAQNVANAYAMNEETAREAEARWFMDNGGRDVAFPEFVDRGL